MANKATVHIVCPCGKLLDTKTVDISSSTIKGTKKCHNCKKTVEFSINNGKCFCNYKN